MPDGAYLHVVTTVDSIDAAVTLSRSVVNARLAACAQVSGPIQSTYWWQGTVEETEEWVITFKTTRAGYAALERHIPCQPFIRDPEILAVPILRGSPDYLHGSPPRRE